MILCIGPTPAAQRVMIFHALALDRVNRATTTLDGAAGKSVNVAKVLRELGDEPMATGFAGGHWGNTILAQLDSRGIANDFVLVSTPTRQCITVIDESSGSVTELVEESRAVTAADYDALLKVVHRHLATCKAVVISGSVTPGGPGDFYAKCIAAANHARVLTVLDASGPALAHALVAHPTIVKPNREELGRTLEATLSGKLQVMEAMRELHQRGAERVVVTAGREPTLAFDGNNFWETGTPAVRTINPIGSGDAFTAGLVHSLLDGENLGQACRWAAASGAANALTYMPGDLARADVERLVRETRMDLLQP